MNEQKKKGDVFFVGQNDHVLSSVVGNLVFHRDGGQCSLRWTFRRTRLLAGSSSEGRHSRNADSCELDEFSGGNRLRLTFA